MNSTVFFLKTKNFFLNCYLTIPEKGERESEKERLGEMREGNKERLEGKRVNRERERGRKRKHYLGKDTVCLFPIFMIGLCMIMNIKFII